MQDWPPLLDDHRVPGATIALVDDGMLAWTGGYGRRDADSSEPVVSLIELIPPPHDPRYALGLEHLGFGVGSDHEAFRERHADVICGQQDQGPFDQPLFISLDAGRMDKFHQRSPHEVTELEGRRFDGFYHA